VSGEPISCPIMRVSARTPPDEARRLQRRANDQVLPSGATIPSEVIRLRPGAYVEREHWQVLDSRAQHIVRVAAVAPVLGARLVSHRSAAALLDWPVLGAWPDRVHVSEPGRVRMESRQRGLVLHPLAPGRVSDAVPIEVVGECVRHTGPVTTAADLARDLPYPDAVVVVDRALREGADPASILASAESAGARRAARARRVIEFADPRSGSAGESLARVWMHALGAPAPVLQHEFRSALGDTAFVDFWFPDQGVIVEFDGEAKYRDQAFLQGRSATDAVIAEKYREDWLRALPDVRGFVRLRWKELSQQGVIARKLRAAGIPLAA